MTIRTPDWRQLAACRTKPPHWWFPARDDDPDARRATAVCWGECPVREQCAADADSRDLEAGAIRGGRTAAERGNRHRAKLANRSRQVA